MHGALLHERVAQVVVRLGIVSVEGDSLTVALDSHVEAVEQLEDSTEVQAVHGVIGGVRDGAADQIDGQVVPATLLSEHAEQVERIGVGRLYGDRTAVLDLGLGDSAAW